MKVFKRALVKNKADNKIVNIKNNDEIVNESFHSAISKVLFWAQFIAVMPIENVTSSDISKLKFKWKSVRTAYTIFHIVYGGSIVILFFRFISGIGISAGNLVGFVFFSYCTSCGIVFLNIAQNWPELMQIWNEHEKDFLKPMYPINGWKLSKKIKFTAIAVFIASIFEHSLFLSSSIYNQYKEVVKCNWTVESPINHFFKKQFGFIFDQVPYHLSFAIPVEILNISLTLNWNYMDLFLMMISIGLVTRFQQINKRLEEYKGKVIDEIKWINIRNQYVLICELVEIVDKKLEYLILLSNINNLYFICFQLLNIYNKLPFAINYIYFWYSLIYLLARTLVTQFLAATVNDESNRPLAIIKTIPTEGHCIELQRFEHQIRTQKIALSGMRFFFLTRKMILKMLTTIVSYELVMLTFYESTKKFEKAAGNPCLKGP